MISLFREGFIIAKLRGTAKFRENETLTKMSKFKLIIAVNNVKCLDMKLKV